MSKKTSKKGKGTGNKNQKAKLSPPQHMPPMSGYLNSADLQRRLGNRGAGAFLQAMTQKYAQSRPPTQTAHSDPTGAEAVANTKSQAGNSRFRDDVNSTANDASLPDPLKAGIEQLSGLDLSDVNVHRNSSKPANLDALAYTQGNDIHLAPGQEQHLPHESWHVVQQRRGDVKPTMGLKGELVSHDLPLEQEADEMGAKAVALTKAPVANAEIDKKSQVKTETRSVSSSEVNLENGNRIVQRRANPEDMAEEMIGKSFKLSAPHKAGDTTLSTGEQVTVSSWSNASDTVEVVTRSGSIVSVPKAVLRPVRAAVADIAPYSAGIGKQAAAVEKNEQALAKWTAGEKNFKTPKAKALFKSEKDRLTSLLKRRQELLNRKLIQETMFNRFDATIKREVHAANRSRGFTGKDALDPNLFKSMLFQETQIGTAGRHMEVGGRLSHPVRSRFNLGQVIDSAGLALLTLLEREQPHLISTFLPTMRADLNNAQRERSELKKKTTLSSAERVRLIELDRLSTRNWEIFIWQYRSSSTVSFFEVINSFFSSQTPALHLDYEFWIHLAVMWLFEKHKPGRSWRETIRAYNGTGQKARDYRDAVFKRARAAQQAETENRDFVPEGI